MTNHIKTEDWARLAAYIDGEGHISIAATKINRGYKMQLSIGNTDIRLVVWLKNNFGGEVREKRVPSQNRRYWYWYAGSKLAAELLTECLPYFIMKRDQAEIAIAYYQTVAGFEYLDGKRYVSPEKQERRAMLATQLKQVREDSAPVIN